MNCSECAYYEYDEEDESYYCTVDMDEDDYARLMMGNRDACPFYRSDDEYAVVRHQMQRNLDVTGGFAISRIDVFNA